MSFQACMERCLPPAGAGGVKPHISGSVFSSHRNRPSTGNRHAAVDFNYKGGQAFNTKKLYAVFSPVDGVISGKFGFSGRYGVVTIKDSKGFYHGILHLIGISVREGQSVSVGTKIGIMGGKGPSGRRQYDVHIHYQLRNNNGVLIDPVAYWDNDKQVYTSAINPDDLNPHEDDPGFDGGVEPSSPSGNPVDYVPRQAGISEYAAIGYACWTNRVPQHEPWPRTMMVDKEFINAPTDEIEHNINHNPQYAPDHKDVGRVEGEERIPRGPFWRR